MNDTLADAVTRLKESIADFKKSLGIVGKLLPQTEPPFRPPGWYGSIQTRLIAPGTHKSCGTGSRTSSNPQRDHMLMESFLELEQAHRLREVTIEPTNLGAMVIVSPDVSVLTLLRHWFKARARAKRYAIERRWS